MSTRETACRHLACKYPAWGLACSAESGEGGGFHMTLKSDLVMVLVCSVGSACTPGPKEFPFIQTREQQFGEIQPLC